ncbi:MAG: hypothetical protein OT477_14800 [Chloroflexi bacterium]|nr:hypothetical protein [Chloroflexota bacterium]
MPVKSGFLSSEFLMTVLVILLPLLGVDIEEQMVAGFVATIYAIGRAVVKARAAEVGETVIGFEGVDLNYSPEDFPKLGQIAYEAYGDFRDWKAWDGKPMPTWAEVNEGIKAAWAVSAHVGGAR